jgi:[ribosomal protein S18]-alanine N-acetyltransferase
MTQSQMTLTLGVSFIRAEAVHAEVLAALHAQCFDRGWSVQSIAELMNLPGALALLAELAPAQPVGFVIVLRAADVSEILTLGVIERHRRSGIARELIAEAGRILAEQGARSLHIEVAESNKPAMTLYEKLGFRHTGRRRDYYALRQGGREDAVTMMSLLPIAPP